MGWVMATVLDVVNQNNERVDQVTLDERIFGGTVNPYVLHATVVMQRAGQRQGTHQTKGRSDVSGGGKKPWKQKGTGRARAGSTRSPLWRHGGTVFGPHPRDYAFQVPKKVRAAALKSSLAAQAQAGRITVLQGLELERASTKALAGVLKVLGAAGRVLLVLPAKDEAVCRAARNLPDVRVLPVQGLNVYDLLAADRVLFTRQALGRLEEVLAP
jgi:large subunit ribosomal protein L4